MPDPDFSVNDVRLCVGECLSLSRSCNEHQLHTGMIGRNREALGVSKLEAWFCGTPSAQLVEPEPYFASGSQLLPA